MMLTEGVFWKVLIASIGVVAPIQLYPLACRYSTSSSTTSGSLSTTRMVGFDCLADMLTSSQLIDPATHATINKSRHTRVSGSMNYAIYINPAPYKSAGATSSVATATRF